ncbi:MAG: nicotinate phosphoribosyltransferase [Deltaproteobacteria bacterium]|nr:nicotinate phosphoribosyltransferase [Deltaproteobacteria bacterium]
MSQSAWVDDLNAALLTDLYELKMLQAYLDEGLEETATFDLFVRRLPKNRNYLLTCGLDDALRYLEQLSFGPECLAYLEACGGFSTRFLDRLSRFRFHGDVFAVPEGTPLFAGEPLLEIVAPLPEAQLVETFVMNQVHFQTLVASKASRVVSAAAGRRIVDFGLRRIHGADAGLKAARAFFIAGVDATSNVLAGRVYGIPTAGTMAHSYVQAHEDESEAFRAFAARYPGTTLLVDTYDTLAGVQKVIRLAREMGDRFDVSALRLDSGDLAELGSAARRMLDEAGLRHVELFASSSLDEYAVAELVASGADFRGFGVGTRMGVSDDAPYLDMAYKLVEYAGSPRTKLSPGKLILPGRKQVFRRSDEGRAVGDVIARRDEAIEGRSLLVEVMRAGRRLAAGCDTLPAARARARRELAALPDGLHALGAADPPYRVEVSPALAVEQQRARTRARG